MVTADCPHSRELGNTTVVRKRGGEEDVKRLILTLHLHSKHTVYRFYINWGRPNPPKKTCGVIITSALD